MFWGSNFRCIIQSVLEYERLDDWKLLVSYYRIEKISETAVALRCLDSKALSYISTIANIPKEEFRLYQLRELHQTHWVE